MGFGIKVEKRRFLLTFGRNLDHSNIDYLVQSRLFKYKGRIQEDYFNPVLKRGAELILNYQIIDTNFNRVSMKYYLDDFHLTEAQKNGFMLSLQKLKGTHVWCDPKVQGHAFCEVNGIKYSFHVYRSLQGQEFRFPEYYNDSTADATIQSQLHKLPEEEQYIQFPADINPEEQDEITIKWIQRLIEMK